MADTETQPKLIDPQELLEALEDYYLPQAHRDMHPADFVTKRYKLEGHEGLVYC